MDERMQFVARRLAGEPMAELCREFGISRKTGYKLFESYQECGVQGLTDRSRRPYRYPNQLPFQVENFILHMKREHPAPLAQRCSPEISEECLRFIKPVVNREIVFCSSAELLALLCACLSG
jgi:hypothetical protein